MFTPFGKRLDKLTFDDIVEFCKRDKSEGINLDYKKEINSSSDSLAKTISSFANTYGGWIIIGVEDDGDDKPKAPFIGIKWQKGMELQVTNIIVDNIYPVVTLDIKTLLNETGDYAFIVLHIAESKTAPHWVNGRKDLFIRQGTRTKGSRSNKNPTFDDYATSEVWEFLRDKRQKSVELAEKLKNDLDNLFCSYKNKEITTLDLPAVPAITLRQAGVTTVDSRVADDGNLNIFIQPIFPRQALVTQEEIMSDYQNNRSKLYYQPEQYSMSGEPHFFTNGVSSFLPENNRVTDFCSFFAQDIFGSAIFRQSVVAQAHHQEIKSIRSLSVPKEGKFVSFGQLIGYTEVFLSYMAAYYRRIGFLGELRIDFSLAVDAWTHMVYFGGGVLPLVEQTPGGDFYDTLELNITELTNKSARREKLFDVYRKMGYFFRWGGVTKEFIDGFYTQNSL